MRLVGTRASRAEHLAARPDADLAADAAAGDATAFGELYRRHADAAWRLAQAVTHNADDASDAVSEAFTKVLQALPSGRLEDGQLFRSYLLTATRNAAIDLIRKGGRTRPTEAIDSFAEAPGGTPGPSEWLTDKLDSALVAGAFRSLPERYRTVLWLTEVEGMHAREVGPLLGVSANNAAQLAVRARAGLRERFLQAHVKDRVPIECRFTVRHLGAYVAGRLSPRDLAKVDQHLAGCAECRTRREELDEVGSSLRRVMLPIPFLLGPTVLAKYKLTVASSTAAATKTAGSGLLGSSTSIAKAQKPLLAVSSGLFALGVISAGVMGWPQSGRPGAPAARVPAAAGPGATGSPRAVVVNQIGLSTPLADALARPSAADAVATGPADPQTQAGITEPETFGGVAAGPAAVAPAPAPAAGGNTAPPPSDDSGATEPNPVVEVGAAVNAGPVDGGISAGHGDGACTGGNLGSQSMGCPPEPAPGTNVGVSIAPDGSALGPLDDETISAGL